MWITAAGLLLALAAGAARLAPAFGRNLALDGLERRGDLCFQRGAAAEAEALWQVVLSETPRSVSARNKLAILKMQKGALTEAQQILAAGVAMLPKEASFQYNLALVHHMRRDWPAALAALAVLERLNPDHNRMHYLKGVVLDELGQHDLAAKEFVKELNVNPAALGAWARLGALPGARVAASAKETPGACR